MRTFLLATVAILAPLMAQAADLPARTAPPPPPVAYLAPAPVFSWTGFYVGVNGGYGWAHANNVEANTNFFAAQGTGYGHNLDGGLFGGQAGYNMQFGQFVLGIEGSGDWSGVKGGKDFTQYSNNTTTSVRDLYMVSGRLGFAVNRLMVYGKGGWAGSHVRAAQDYYGNLGSETFSNTAFQNGWQVGVGFEYAFLNNISLGVEYTHVDLGSENHTGLDSAGVPTSIGTKVREDLVLGKINYRF